ncbi:small ribosomal subunit protein uS7-like isoform X2 [Magnolia sinica]|uniref:small ribosomal subunit protein uS7-like isoform X2 n=1 Tax=Magnolia sinica TaxID=86752 RepID=UPI0026594202|nr:small ribosomal subunit protein uS7-like isoform X2 [Magnolia sinica]
MAVELMLFNTWAYDDVHVDDVSLQDYIAMNARIVPHTAGRYSKRFPRTKCPIIERLTNSLMMHGRNNGKKLMAIRIVKDAMERIHTLTQLNPIQVIVNAIIKSGPRADVVRVGFGPFVRRQAVDVSPHRRVGQAIYLLTTGARKRAFRSRDTTIAACLADELISASQGGQNSYAITKKNQIERVAMANL